jgi:shikimate dehydrogenase
MDTTALTKDTQLCISLAGRPSNVGTRFHNHLYAELGLDFVYKAFTTTDLPAAVAGIRALGIRGCGVSMPFKQDVIAAVDSLDASARAIGSVNTIVNTDGHLRAYNTDYLAIVSLLSSHGVPTDLPFAVLGSGGMARAVVAALRDSGFAQGSVVARNEAAGRALAQEYGYGWVARAGSDRPGLVVNATPVGMAGGPASDDLPVDVEVIDAASVVFEVVAMPVETPMVRRARGLGTPVITGDQVLALQAAEQFVLYTGVRPSPDQLARATAFSRAGAP